MTIALELKQGEDGGSLGFERIEILAIDQGNNYLCNTEDGFYVFDFPTIWEIANQYKVVAAKHCSSSRPDSLSMTNDGNRRPQ